VSSCITKAGTATKVPVALPTYYTNLPDTQVYQTVYSQISQNGFQIITITPATVTYTAVQAIPTTVTTTATFTGRGFKPPQVSNKARSVDTKRSNPLGQPLKKRMETDKQKRQARQPLARQNSGSWYILCSM